MVVVAAFALTNAAAHAAQGPFFGPPSTISPGAVQGVAPALDGSLSVLSGESDLQSASSILRIVRRRPGNPGFDAPEEIAREPGAGSSSFGGPRFTLTTTFARSPLGQEVVAWLPAPTQPGDPIIRLRASNGQTFGPVEDVALPARLPAKPGNENVVAASRSISVAAALATDGTLALAACETDYRSDTHRMLLWLRPPGEMGSWNTFGRCTYSVRLGTDSSGRIDALWSGPEDGAPDNAPRVIWTTARAPLQPGFGPRQPLSDPSRDADNGSSPPDLVTSPIGEALAIWNGPGNGTGPVIANEAFAAVRTRDGSWGAPQQLSDAGHAAFRPSAAVSATGEMVVAWASGGPLVSTLRSPGGRFGRLVTTPISAGQVEKLPLALDSLGTTVAVRRSDNRLQASLRTRSGDTSQETAVSPPGGAANDPSIVTDPFGNGLLIWTRVITGASGYEETLVAPYSAAPPAVSHLVVLPTGNVTVKLNEPGRLSLSVTAEGTSAKQVFAVLPKPGVVKLLTVGKVRRLLRAHATRRLTLRARDAGPRVRTLRKRLPRRR
jgi:hypothetical protein